MMRATDSSVRAKAGPTRIGLNAFRYAPKSLFTLKEMIEATGIDAGMHLFERSAMSSGEPYENEHNAVHREKTRPLSAPVTGSGMTQVVVQTAKDPGGPGFHRQ
jgi:hypothetical protein